MNTFLSMHRMMSGSVLTVFLLVFLLMGCQAFKGKPAEEAAIDKALTQQSPPALLPVAKPPAPQEDFEQEPLGAQG